MSATSPPDSGPADDLDSFDADLAAVESALEALDADDLDTAEAHADSLVNPVAGVDVGAVPEPDNG